MLELKLKNHINKGTKSALLFRARKATISVKINAALKIFLYSYKVKVFNLVVYLNLIYISIVFFRTKHIIIEKMNAVITAVVKSIEIYPNLLIDLKSNIFYNEDA